MNNVQMMGRMTKDVELRTTTGGTTIAKGAIAVSSYAGKDANGNAKERVCFLDFVAFDKTAENIAKFFRKGSPIVLEGELEFQQWEKDGVKRSKHELKVQRFHFVLAEPKGTDGPSAVPNSSAKPAPADYGDLPF